MFSAPANTTAPTPDANAGIMDLFGTSNVPLAPTTSGNNIVNNSMMDLSSPTPPVAPMGSNDFTGMTMPVPAPASDPVIQAYDKGGLKIVFYVSKPNPDSPSNTNILVKFSNSNASPLSSLVFQVNYYYK